MTNKEYILNDLSNNVEKLARMLIDCKDITGWDEIPDFEYTTSDGQKFYEFEYALRHEIEWLNAKNKSVV